MENFNVENCIFGHIMLKFRHLLEHLTIVLSGCVQNRIPCTLQTMMHNAAINTQIASSVKLSLSKLFT